MILLFLCGALSILAQVILLRELVAAFYGVDLIYLLALGAWLLWTALGALVGRRSLAPSSTGVAAVLVGSAAAIPIDLLVIRRLRLLLEGVPGAFLPLPQQVAASVFCLIVPSVLLGLLFQFAAKRYLEEGPNGPGAARGANAVTLARAYAVECFGAMAAGIVSTGAVYWHIQNVTLACAAAALAGGGAVAQLLHDPRVASASGGLAVRVGRLALGAAACVMVLAGVLGVLGSRSLDLRTTAWNHPGVVDTIDTPYGRTTITQQAGQVAVYENDALVFDNESTAAEELAHLSLMQHPSPRRILTVEGASAGILPYVLGHGAAQVDALEGDRRLVGLLQRRLPPPFGSALSHAPVRLVFDDPRRALADCVAVPCRDRYDVILIASAEPSSAQANRFFTREFFAECARRLAPGGIVSLRLPSVENFWTPQVAARAGAIYAALASVFADVVVLPGSSNVVVASPHRLVRDPAILSERLASRNIHASLVTARYVRYLYSNDRYLEIEQTLQRARVANTDAQPASYQATMLLWISKFVPAAGTWDLTWAQQTFGWRSPWSWVAVVVLAMAMWLTTGQRLRPPAVVGITATAGMALEVVLVVHYQLKQGVVFADLGILLMSVMGGLAAGALGAERVHARSPRSGWWTGWTLLSFVLLSIATALAIRSGLNAGLIVTSLALVATGLVVAFVFSMVAAESPVDQRRLVSPLYAADVLGGAVGSVAASLILIPLAGLPATAGYAAAIAAIALLAFLRK